MMSETKPMNTVAKRKVEQIISEEINLKIEKFKGHRREEHQSLVKKYEDEPSQEALEIQKEIDSAEKNIKRLEKKLESTGYERSHYGSKKLRLVSKTHYGRTYKDSWQEYYAHELSEHSKETAETVAKLEMLARNYVLKIWAGEASQEANFLEAFEKELSALGV
jgi:hypothetical protein